jgi:hypothetical protein
VILPTTTLLAANKFEVFCVAQSVSAAGEQVRVRLEGSTLLKCTTNALPNTLLIPTNASVSAADMSGAGSMVIARSKEGGAGVRRVFFNGFGIGSSP